jgi:hypothetical protein
MVQGEGYSSSSWDPGGASVGNATAIVKAPPRWKMNRKTCYTFNWKMVRVWISALIVSLSAMIVSHFTLIVSHFTPGGQDSPSQLQLHHHNLLRLHHHNLLRQT